MRRFVDPIDVFLSSMPISPEMEGKTNDLSLRTVAAECFITKGQFTDRDFPRNDSSLYVNAKVTVSGLSLNERVAKWLRPDEFAGAQDVLMGVSLRGRNGLTLENIRVASNKERDANWWLLGALVVVATGDKRGNTPLFTEFDERLGFYKVRLYQDGVPRDIVVDDSIPCLGGGQPAYAVGDIDQAWLPIVEKAFAKMYGNYEKLMGTGSVGSALVDLTGGVVQRFVLANEDESTIYSAITKAFNPTLQDGFFAGLSTASVGPDESSARDDGLIAGRVYPIVSVDTRFGTSLVVSVRDPYSQGNRVIEVSLSDLAATFAKLYVVTVPETLKQREIEAKKAEKERKAALAAERGLPVNPDDEQQQEEEEDLDEEGGNSSVGPFTRLFRSKWNTALSGGGPSSHPDTWLNNPQFKVTVGSPGTTVIFQLSQEDVRPRGKLDLPKDIGLVVLAGNEGARREHEPPPGGDEDDPEANVVPPVDPSVVLASSDPMATSREVSLTYTFEEPGDYIVLAATYRARQKGRFLLRCVSLDKPQARAGLEIEPFDDANTVNPEDPPLTVEEIAAKLKNRGDKYEDPDFSAGYSALYGTERALPKDDALYAPNWRRPKDILTPPPPPPPTEAELREREAREREALARAEEEEEDEDEDEDEAARRRRKKKAAGKKGNEDDEDSRGGKSKKSSKKDSGKGSKKGKKVESEDEEEEEEVLPYVVPEPLLFPVEESTDPEDPPPRFASVVQGNLGDCYLLGALGILATRPALLRSLIVSSDFEAGVHEVRFFRMGEWVTVAVDDLLPCGEDGLPLFGRARPPKPESKGFDERAVAAANEFWPAIIEKAYAKLNGGYYNIEDGSLSSVLVELTSFNAEQLGLATPEAKKLAETGELWERLQDYKGKGYLMGCSGTADRIEVSENGIIKDHAYGIVDVRESHGNNLVRLWNPWGGSEWTGPFCDHSKDWSKKILKDLEYAFDTGDGTFWMPFESFLEEFSTLYLCKELSTEEPEEEGGSVWVRKEVRGAWDFKYSGGTEADTWLRNPQYHLSVAEPKTRVVVTIQQPDVRNQGLGQNFPQGVGVFVLANVKRLPDEDDENPPDEIPEPKRLERIALGSTPADVIVAQANPHYGQTVSVEVVLDANRDYVVMPVSDHRGHLGPYYITVHAKGEFEIEPLKGDAKPVLPLVEKRLVKETFGKWTLAKSGGCPNFDTWANNPQYTVTPVRNMSVSIDLEQLDAQGNPIPESSVDLNEIGFVVVRNRWLDKVPAFDKKAVRGFREYEAATLVTVDMELEAGQHYVIVPSTYHPGRLGRFRLRVSAFKDREGGPTFEHFARFDDPVLVDTTQDGPRATTFALDEVHFRQQSLKSLEGKEIQRTLVILKPDALGLGSAEVIISMIEDQAAMTIIQHMIVELNIEQAREFAPQESDAVVEFLASGPILAMVVMGPSVVSEFQLLAGDPDPSRAQLDPSSPATIRAMFGTDVVRNAVYCSETELGARRDIKFFFPDMVVEPLPEAQDAKKFLAQSVYPALIEGLTELCKAKPADPKLWLGNWLIDNNPTRPLVADPAKEKQEYTVDEPIH